jgi:hypothetical protein
LKKSLPFRFFEKKLGKKLPLRYAPGNDGKIIDFRDSSQFGRKIYVLPTNYALLDLLNSGVSGGTELL